MPGLFSSPSDNAAQAASATAAASNQEIGQEEQYVNQSEGNLRGAIAGLGPNPYFSPPKPPAAVDPKNTANFFSPAPGGANGAAPPPATAPNLFAAPAAGRRQAQPAGRAPVTAVQ